MVHYRHSYHAGNFADVFKHVLLVGLLAALNKKDKPWCFFDTHAGAGSYDLGGEGASRTGEWSGGIGRLADAADGDGAPETVSAYLQAVRAANGPGSLRRYPGSPEFALALARPDDRLVLCEKVPEVAAALKANLHDARVAVHLRDGYEAHALLPPAQKRGLVLVDPPFERGDEFEAIAEFIGRACARFAGGIYAAWYPLKNRHLAERFGRRVARAAGRPVLRLELDTDARWPEPERGAGGRPAVEKHRMNACGLLVVNPPFGFDESARAALQWLQPRLAQGPRAGFTITQVEAE